MADESGHYTSIDGQRLGPNQSLVWPRRAPEMQPAQQQGPPPANKVLAKMSDRALKGIDQKYAPAFDKLQTDLEYEVRRINEQFDIKQQDMYRLFTSESDPKRKKAIESQMLTAKNAAQARIADVRSKQQPAADQINAARQQEIQATQRKIAEKNIALQTIEGLVQSGVIQDTAVATQAAYSMLGINIPLSGLRPKQATLEQAKTAIEDDLRDVRAMLESYKPASGKLQHFLPGGKPFGLSRGAKITDPVTDIKREATEDEIKQFESLAIKEKQLTTDYQNLLMQSDPRFRATIERTRQFEEAKKKLAGGARPNIETAIKNEIGKKTRLPIGQMIKKLRAQGLGREEIKAQLVGMGYK